MRTKARILDEPALSHEFRPLVNTALPGIAASLQADPASAIWVINAWPLAAVVSLLPFAALGDRWGPPPVYLVWPTACTAWPPRELCKPWAPELPTQGANHVLAVVAGQGHEVGEDLGPIAERRAAIPQPKCLDQRLARGRADVPRHGALLLPGQLPAKLPAS
jgi:hypothetical protein